MARRGEVRQWRGRHGTEPSCGLSEQQAIERLKVVMPTVLEFILVIRFKDSKNAHQRSAEELMRTLKHQACLHASRGPA